LGFARLISRRQLAQHVLEIRAEGFPAYQVSPAGERELYSAIIYLEPFRDRNLRAFGYDMLSEPVRREAMERARDQDTAALSGKVVLVQETGNEVQAGTLMYVPVYQAGMPIATVAQRRAAIRGWVYSPYRMADLLRGILGGWDLENNGRIRLEVYDGERVVPENLLYDSRSAGDRQTGSAPRLNSQEQVVSAGRRWTLRFTAAGSRAATAGYGKVWLVAFGGTGASLLLAWLLFDLLNARVMARQLSNREEELRTMAEAMPQIVWIARPDGWNIFLNKLWMDYTGLTLEESLGHAWVKAVHPDDQGMAMEAWQKARAEHGIYSIEGRLRRADGVYRWWLVRAVPLLDAAGNILKWYGTCTDIHDLKMSQKEREEMQSQLNQSQKMETVGQLAGGVAHDFNNLLTAIIGYGGFLMKDLAEGDAKREDVKEILTAAERAAGLTKQLLAFSRKQILKTETVDLNSIVWGIGKMLRRLIGEDIKLETRYAPSPCHVQIDIGQIEQMIVNLAVNARDAMPKGGTLVLATAHMDAGEDFVLKHPAFSPGPLVCLTLKDTGCGMTDNTKEHLFEPFFTTKEKGRGSGLGLSTVFGIVKQSGGEIEVESAPDRGTTFNIYLPQGGGQGHRRGHSSPRQRNGAACGRRGKPAPAWRAAAAHERVYGDFSR
jgi:PAS domain S-box-containing protein